MQMYVTFVEKESCWSSLKIKTIGKLEIISMIQENIEAQNLEFVT